MNVSLVGGVRPDGRRADEAPTDLLERRKYLAEREPLTAVLLGYLWPPESTLFGFLAQLLDS